MHATLKRLKEVSLILFYIFEHNLKCCYSNIKLEPHNKRQRSVSLENAMVMKGVSRITTKASVGHTI